MILAAAFSPSLDITYVVAELRLGQIHRPAEVVRCAGGKALNMARAAHRLGAETTAVALLGGPTAEVLLGLLAADGLQIAKVPAPTETRTCVSIASSDTGALTEVYEHAPAVPPASWDAFRSRLTTAMTTAHGWLALCGGAPLGLPAEALAELVALGHRAGLKVAVDTSGAALAPAVAARPDLVKVNRAEAAELLGLPAATDLLAMAAAVRERTGHAAVLTDGADGAVALDDQQAVRAHLPPIAGHFPVGSGDSFLGGLLAALDAGRPLAEALVEGTAAGAANALRPGPGRFDPDDAERLATTVELEVLPAALREVPPEVRSAGLRAGGR